jgi:hypothetical protein
VSDLRFLGVSFGILLILKERINESNNKYSIKKSILYK